MGDHVVIQCDNTITPAVASPPTKGSVSTTYKVIGFKDHPKPCAGYGVFIISGSLEKSSAVIWDCAKNELVMGPIDTTNTAYLAWIAAHHSIGEEMFDELRTDNSSPFKWHPELVDPNPQNPEEIIYYHDLSIAAYWRNVLMAASPEEITGIRTAVKNTRISHTTTSYWFLNGNDEEGYWTIDPYALNATGLTYEEQVDILFATIPGLTGVFLYVYIIDAEYKNTKEFYGPYGKMGTFTGGSVYNTNEYDGEGTEITLIPVWPRVDGYWRFVASQTGKFKSNTFAMATILQYQPCTIYTHGRDGTAWNAEPIVPEIVTHTFGERVTLVQAQACVVPDGQTWLDCGENTILNGLLADAVDMFYDLNPSAEGISCGITVNLMG